MECVTVDHEHIAAGNNRSGTQLLQEIILLYLCTAVRTGVDGCPLPYRDIWFSFLLLIPSAYGCI